MPKEKGKPSTRKPGRTHQHLIDNYSDLPDDGILKNGHVLALYRTHQKSVPQTLRAVVPLLPPAFTTNASHIRTLGKRYESFKKPSSDAEWKRFLDFCDKQFKTVSVSVEEDVQQPMDVPIHSYNDMDKPDIEVIGAPVEEESYQTLLTPDAVQFVAELTNRFQSDVDQLFLNRKLRKVQLDQSGALPDFSKDTKRIRNGDWRVPPVPGRLANRHIDLGDVSPANTQHFVAALNSAAQGIQVDLDDGHCPSWPNQLKGLYNVYKVVHGSMEGVPSIEMAPLIMLRPRAWNMIETNVLVNGRQVPGPLFDFGISMFHNAKILLEKESGPYFYLSKLEGHSEARLWNQIFEWTEVKLGLPVGCTKAVVLIENILAAFEMHEILYELRQHSAGLNCGVWDYSASFINKFGHRSDFVLPDRSKYVNIERHFLKSYVDLTIKTCHKHGCHATGGMSASILPTENCAQRVEIIEKVSSSKLKEIQAGVDGFLVYDIGLIAPLQELWKKHAPSDNQYHIQRLEVEVGAKDLLLMPKGGVTMGGLKNNIAVCILFINAWFTGKGHFIHNGAVEDSATAEISRSQVWQWIRHRTKLEDDDSTVTFNLVKNLVQDFVKGATQDLDTEGSRQLDKAAGVFQTLIVMREFPEFITTYLSTESAFLDSIMNHGKE